MIQRTKSVDGGRVLQFMAEKQSYTATAVKEEFEQDGVKMYRLTDGSERVASVYDKMFKPAVSLVMKKGKSKGDNPDRTRNWMK